MKIRINTEGELEIERAGAFKKSTCPFDTREYCGDWCALFGEPGEKRTSSVLDGVLEIHLELCQKTLRCAPEEFEDLRKVDGDE